MKKTILLTILIISLALTGCALKKSVEVDENNQNRKAQNSTSENTQVANPASSFCIEKGGKSQIVETEDGSQAGICKFADSSWCDEWAFYRGECKPGDSIAPTPVSLNTVDWETYRNEKYGFEIKYPNGWFIYTNNPDDLFFQPTKEEDFSGIPGPHATAFEIEITPVTNNDALSNIVRKPFDQAGVEFTQETFYIDGISGLKAISVCDGVGCGSPEWYFIKNNNFYSFKSNLGFGYSEIFDKILSTFKFTN